MVFIDNISDSTMPRKCCVKDCKTGYYSQKDGPKVTCHTLPSEQHEPEERRKWLEVLYKVTENLNVNQNTVVCSKHWPEGFSFKLKKGHKRPVDPPSVFASNIQVPIDHSYAKKDIPDDDHSYAMDWENFSSELPTFDKVEDKLDFPRLKDTNNSLKILLK